MYDRKVWQARFFGNQKLNNFSMVFTDIITNWAM